MRAQLWKTSLTSAASMAGLVALSAVAWAQPAMIVIGNDGEHPESITTSPDGTTLFIGSLGKSAVYRVPVNGGTVEPFITDGLNMVTGVFAVGDTLWVCSSSDFNGDGPAYANAYDLATGDLKNAYELPGGGFCNDFAVGRDGTVFVSDTAKGRILALRPGASELTVFVQDDLLAGVDGLALLDGDLIANSVTTNKLLVIDILADFTYGSIREVAPSQPLEGPDGMRALRSDQGLLLIEGNRLDLVTLAGPQADVQVLQDGFNGATGVTQVGHAAYVVEGKLNYLFDPTLGDPGEFDATLVPVP